MIFLFVAAGIVGAAGLLVLGFGIPIKDTTFGNAMLLSSMMLLCTSLVLAGLGFVVRELRAVVRALAQGGVRVAQRAQPARPTPSPRVAAQPGLAPPIDQGAPSLAEEPSFSEAQSAVPPPWAAEAAARDRARNVTPGSQPAPPPIESPVPPPPPAPERPPRRNLLFATRKRDRAEAASGASAEQPMSAEMPKMAPPVLPPMTALEAEPKASFDSAWPAAGRGNDPFGRRSRSAEAAPAPTAAPEPSPVVVAAEPPPPPPAPPAVETAPAVTVIKSGVVDGMAYSLYSDGSIEAQMPEGMLRFASLDELRMHLEQRP
jgi:hypothetical protein